jgi:hypothetical protein
MKLPSHAIRLAVLMCMGAFLGFVLGGGASGWPSPHPMIGALCGLIAEALVRCHLSILAGALSGMIIGYFVGAWIALFPVGVYIMVPLGLIVGTVGTVLYEIARRLERKRARDSNGT